MTDEEVFKKITDIINSRRPLNNPFDDTYVRRLQYYPEFLKMPYWLNFMEYVGVSKYLKETNFQGKILDFGCGSGHMDILLGRDGYKIHGIDLSPMAIDICNVLRDNESEEVQKRVSYSLEDITWENVKNDSFDLVWSSHVMEHILNPAPIFEGLRKRVPKGAKMRVSVPLGYAYNDPDHVHHWADRAEFEGFFSKFITVDDVVIEPWNKIIIGYFSF